MGHASHSQIARIAPSGESRPRKRDCFAIAAPAVREQNAASDFAVVFATAVEPGNFPPFTQIEKPRAS